MTKKAKKANKGRSKKQKDLTAKDARAVVGGITVRKAGKGQYDF